MKGLKINSRKQVLNLDNFLSPNKIREGLKTDILAKEIHYLNKIDSTNTYAKELAAAGCDEGTIVVAEEQTKGRGRLGRFWNSDNRKGVWMSIIFKPDITPTEANIFTIGASVAVVLGIKNTTGILSGIKWPNDILLVDKKVGGILTELKCEGNFVKYVIVGVGINVNQGEEDFSKDIRKKATSIKIYRESIEISDGKSERNNIIRRSDIIKGILTEMEVVYNSIINKEINDIIDKWKKYSAVLGKDITVISNKGEFTGKAEDIALDGRLIVKGTDGTKYALVSGEISIKL